MKPHAPGAQQLGLIQVYTLLSKLHHTLQEKDELNRTEIYYTYLLTFVLQSKCPAESIDSSGKTALHYAGNFPSLCFLLP